MDIETGSYSLRDLDRINVVLGKNGCGKSPLLRNIAAQTVATVTGRMKYVTPERGGVLTYDANTENNVLGNPDWMRSTRNVNQFNQFKQQSVAQFRRLADLTYRSQEDRREIAEFQPNIDSLNSLLDQIELQRGDPAFKLVNSEGIEIAPNEISSGESELVSLAIEVLTFVRELEPAVENLLLLDEPDVHLHPDLQGRFISFVRGLVDEHGFRVLIATHSTAILGGLAGYDGARVALMRAGDKELPFESVDEVYRRVLPVFGAHPLSNVFNEKPLLIVEGADDERVWQQAVRSSGGGLNVYPVACEGVSGMSDYEKQVNRIVTSIYDDPKAYSLRDADGIEEEITDEGVVVRFRLKCRAAENLLLANEVLESVGKSFDDIQMQCEAWLAANAEHQAFDAMRQFRDGGYDRRGHDVKDIRTVLAGQIMGSSKSWEVLVGQAIGRLKKPDAGEALPSGTIPAFLGEKLMNALWP